MKNIVVQQWKLGLLCFMISCWLMGGTAMARAPQADTLVLPQSFPDTAWDIRQYTTVFENASKISSIDKIIHQYFLSPRNFHDLAWQNHAPHDFWLKISVFNNGVQRDDICWFVGYVDHAFFYALQPDGTYGLVAKAGLMETGSGWKKWYRFAFPLHLPANSTSVFYLHIVNTYDVENPLYSRLYTTAGWNQFAMQQSREFLPISNWVFFITGLLSIIAILSFIGYIQTRASLYAWVAWFSCAAPLYFFAQLAVYPYQFSLFSFWPILRNVFDLSGPLLCFYLPFIGLSKHIVSTHLSSPKLTRIFAYLLVCIAALILGQWILLATQQDHAARVIYILFFYIALLPAVAFFWRLNQHKKDQTVKYFLFGAVILFSSGIVSFHTALLFNTSLPSYGLNLFSFKVLMVGTTLAMICFLMSAMYHSRRVQTETIIRQQKLIQEMAQQTQKLQQDVEQLQQNFTAKDQQLASVTKELNEQLRLKLEAEYQLKLSELELKAIKAQMNPHFIFNCLNSIQLFIMQKHDELAQEYLSDFSLLIRQTLEMARLNFVSLEEEIRYLQTYLRLEKMRFEERMDYEIHVDPKIDPDRTEIPTMLLQPYVENAVKHGINHPIHKGKIRIHFQEKEDLLICTIEDNGIGIKRTRAMGMDNFRKHLIAGMELSRMRAEWINKLFHTDIQIEVIDKEEKFGDMSGTLVQIVVPQA